MVEGLCQLVSMSMVTRPRYMFFPTVMRIFAVLNWVPSTLCCDNTQEGKSGKVLEFNCKHLVKDELSEINSQQQNTLEMGGIIWLKAALNVIQDMTTAPDMAWFIALKYLAKINKFTWN